MTWVRLLCFCLACAPAAIAAEWWQLPLAGSVSGEMVLLGEEGPRLRWKVTGISPAASNREIAFTIEGEDALVRGRAVIDVVTGEGSWKIEEGAFALKTWFASVAKRLGEAMVGLTADGRLTLSGEGVLVAGKPYGLMQVRIIDGMLRNTADDWELGGISAEGNFDLEGKGDLRSTVTTLRYGSWMLQDGRLGLSLGSGRMASITGLEVSGLGGKLAVDPFALALDRPDAALTLRLSGVSLQELIAYLPEALSEATGRVDGQMEVRWSVDEGLQIGAGWLGLTEGSTASVRLAPVPGMITVQLGDDNPAFMPLQRIELGQTPLNVTLLRAVFSPEGDERGRTASVRLHAEPVDPMLKAPFIIDVNVAGPLEQLLKLGLDGRVSF